MHRHSEGVEANFIYPVLQDRAGDVWVSSGFRGLTRLRNGRFETLTIDGRPQISEISSCSKTPTARYGSVFFARAWPASRRTPTAEPDLSAQIDGRVDAIYRDRAGMLWFGGIPSCIWRDGRPTRFTSKQGLAFDHVKAIYQDASRHPLDRRLRRHLAMEERRVPLAHLRRWLVVRRVITLQGMSVV